MKISNTSLRLKELMVSRKLKQIDILRMANPFCREYGIKMNRSDISQYVNGKAEPGQDKLTILSKALSVSEPWLMGYDVEPDIVSTQQHLDILPVTKRRIPMLGTIAAGQPIYAEEEYDAYVVDGSDCSCDFALRVSGDSMEPRFLDGDIVFFRSQDDVLDGQIAAVIIDDTATLKHVYHMKSGVQLVSDNSKYPPMIFDASNSSSARILGLAVGYYRNLD